MLKCLVVPLCTFLTGRGALLIALVPLSGCDQVQSALNPQGPVALEISRMGWIMFWGAVAVVALVLSLLLYAIFSAPENRRPLDANKLIIGGGIILPVVSLSALLIYGTLFLDQNVVSADGSEPLEIEVIGSQWWWEIRYPGARGDEAVVTAEEIVIPVGRAVNVSVQTRDVIHSFWVPSLAGKIDLIPGKVNRISLRADKSGVFRGQCAEFCGIQHARMGIFVYAVAPAEFEAWLHAQRQPASAATSEVSRQGEAAFFRENCSSCHTIRGTPAAGKRGPDLTHLGSRRTLGAGTLPNTHSSLAHWIAHHQSIKRGNKMPSYAHLDTDTVATIAAYLEELK